MRPSTKLRSEALKADELEKVHGGKDCRGLPCGVDYHCSNCNYAWPQSGGIYCPICLKNNDAWY